jgi:hypothetical protein
MVQRAGTHPPTGSVLREGEVAIVTAARILVEIGLLQRLRTHRRWRQGGFEFRFVAVRQLLYQRSSYSSGRFFLGFHGRNVARAQDKRNGGCRAATRCLQISN